MHSVRVACQYKEILENEREMCGFFATAGLSYSFNKRSSRAGRRAGREINQRGKLFLRSMGQIARERAEFPVIFLRQERIRMAGGRGGTATRQRALQLQRRETQNQQGELLNRFTCLSCLLGICQAGSKLSSRRSATSPYQAFRFLPMLWRHRSY